MQTSSVAQILLVYPPDVAISSKSLEPRCAKVPEIALELSQLIPAGSKPTHEKVTAPIAFTR
jgi:hypothetical protein